MVLVVPLLFETGSYRELVRRVVTVDCSEERQFERATRRSRISEEEVRAMGITAVPTFIFERRTGIAGAYPAEQLAAAIRQASSAR